MIGNFARNMDAVSSTVRLGPFALAGAEKVLKAVDNMGRTGPLPRMPPAAPKPRRCCARHLKETS